MHLAASHIEPDAAEEKCFRELVYTPLDEALVLLRSRQPNTHLPSEDIPTPFSKGNCAILFRFVASPNHELLRFVERATQHGLHPIVLEYHADKFVSRNPIKHSLCKMGFSAPGGKNGKTIIERHSVVNFNCTDGQLFSDMATAWDEPFIAFHHRMLFSERPDLTIENLFEASAWFSKYGAVPRFYYEWLFSLMLSNAILFETYLFDSLEAAFTREVILPAFCAVREKFGIKPLVTSLDPPGQEGDKFWALYPARLKRHLGKPAKKPILGE